jgi:hypothetical protein
MKTIPRTLSALVVSLVAFGGIATPLSASAEDAPLSHKASPEVYRLLAENDQFRVILGTWKPGQRDEQHSHSTGVHYRLTDCKQRVFAPDGKVINEGEVKAGSVLMAKPTSSHSFQNVGTADCQTLLVESK